MKKVADSYPMSIVISLVVILAFSFHACDSEEKTDERQRMINRMVDKQWSVHSVQGPTADETLQYQNFQIRFEKSAAGAYTVNYTPTNGNVIWPEAGQIELTEPGGFFSRSDQITGKIETVTEQELTFSLEWNKTTVGPGREKSTDGEYIFSLVSL